MSSHSRYPRRIWMTPTIFISVILTLQVSHVSCFFTRGTFAPVRAPPPVDASVLFAKKGGKKKGAGGKNKNKKQSGFAWAQDFTLAPFESSEGRSLSSLLCSSYESRTGKSLDGELRGAADLPKVLWKSRAACVLVVAEGPEPVRYANVAALECLGISEGTFGELVGAKSFAGGSVDFPGKMAKKYESGYTKKVFRANSDVSDETGARKIDITICDACRWTLEKATLVDGKFVAESAGVAYAWSSWTEGDETVNVDGTRMTVVDPEKIQERIEEQGALVRKLKEEDGLGNKDPAVMAAVATLLKLKAMLPE